MQVIDQGELASSFESGIASAKLRKPNSFCASLQHLQTCLVRVIESGNRFTKRVQSPTREPTLARMLRSSPMVIFGRRLCRSLPPLSNSGVVDSEWLAVMAGVASELKTAGKRERTKDGKRFWLIFTGAGVLRPGEPILLKLGVFPQVIVRIEACKLRTASPIGLCAPPPIRE